ncbi:MAG: hypothetical protein IJ685_01200 [Selenomonadaceae bacterium]|nr:hypothetical protein [Selenomonadaceae bacterium]
MRKQRISVSLPADMLENYKMIASESGISVSRLIYLRLRSRKKSIVVVGQDVLNAIRELKTLVNGLLKGNSPRDEIVQSLIRYTRFLENFVELDGENEEIVKGGDRSGN